MSNTTVVPHLFGILRSSPFQQGVARHSQTRTALEEGNTTQSYSTRTIHQWKPQLETIPSMYSTFAAELIQPPFRQLTFSHVRHCSPDYTVDSMYSTRTTDGNHARTQMVLRNQDSFDQTANVVVRGKEFCLQLR